jgi:preprotein translocase subunit SecG
VIYIVYTIHILVCPFLIMVVLLQQGKGADLSVFGGGSTQAAFGARGAATLLHKMTVGAFVAFIFTTMAIGFLQTGGTGSSVMSTVVEEEATPSPTVAPEAAGGEPEAAPAGDEALEVEPPAGEQGEAVVEEEIPPPPADEQ